MNVDLTHRILDTLGKPRSLIKPVADRPGHDRRYCLDTTKLRGLGWAPHVPFETGLSDSVKWYRENEWWWRPIKERDPAFKAYYQAQYEKR
jgi:dTDP-glucose 4,6-dehydratase